MRRWFFAITGVLIPLVVKAGPFEIHTSSMMVAGLASIFALIVEAGIVALLLTFVGLRPIRIFLGFLLASIAVFVLVFWPLRERLPFAALEMLVAAIDAISIWLLSRVPAFQGDSYRRLGWIFAGIASLIGNAASFCVGVMASGHLWFWQY
jgi:hypothetical protein